MVYTKIQIQLTNTNTNKNFVKMQTNMDIQIRTEKDDIKNKC